MAGARNTEKENQKRKVEIDMREERGEGVGDCRED
jgi:hypothetical protein